MNKRIFLAAIICVTVWLLTAGVSFGATVLSKPLNATVRVIGKGDFSYYSDAAATQPITSITLPDVTPGGSSTFTIYVKNTGTVDETLAAGVNNMPASAGTLALTFDGLSTKTIAVGAVSKVVIKLTSPATATAGNVNFTFNVDAAQAAVTATTTTTSSTPPGTTTTTSAVATVSYNTSVQPAFNLFCVSCHGGAGGVNLGNWTQTTGSSYGLTPIVVPGNAAGSKLYQSVTSGNMSGYGMSSAQIQSLADWINQGAPNN